MSRVLNNLPRVAIFLAGVAAAAITLPRRAERGGVDPAVTDALKQSLADLEARLQSRETSDAAHFAQIEVRLEEQAAKLQEVPSTAQIVAAMEQLLTRTMASLDDRLTTQAHSIEVLKSTVSQTDSLLERVLESLDSLQSLTDTGDLAEDPLRSQSTV
jgi:chromosome segregation ATPase